MRDLWHLFRGNLPRLEGLSYAFEKGGLTLERQPIPWCADSVLVSALVELPQQIPRSKGDFMLYVGGETYLPESQRLEDPAETTHLQFRLPVPGRSSTAEVIWRGRSIGQAALPILSADEFSKKLTLQTPTVSVRMGAQAVACQTYVTTQCQGLILAGILCSPTCLAPIVELGLRVSLRREEGQPMGTAPVQLSSSQLRSRQALVVAVFPKPKRGGTWHVTWQLGDRPLATHSLKAIAQRQFVRSLRVCSTRFVVQNKRGALKMERFLLDFKGIARVGPCFLVSSSETGMAGWCTLQVRAHLKGAGEPILLQEQEVLVSDGPVPFISGTLEVDELDKVKHFDLCCGRTILGTLPLSPVPTAAFTQEGGFVAPDTFEWTGAAEEQLQQRLGRLLDP
jgi:hypothetical protein